jgi:hypothetical protein
LPKKKKKKKKKVEILMATCLASSKKSFTHGNVGKYCPDDHVTDPR